MFGGASAQQPKGFNNLVHIEQAAGELHKISRKVKGSRDQ